MLTDHEVNFGIPKKRFRRNEKDVKVEQDQCDQLSLLSDESGDSISNEYKDDDEGDYEVPALSEDDGVFDVDNGSTSSLAESQMSTTLPQAQVSANHSDNCDSSSEESNVINFGEEDDGSSEVSCSNRPLLHTLH